MWPKLLEFIQTSQGLGVLGLVGIGLYLVWQNWDAIKARIPSRVTDTVSDSPSRREVLDYLDACYAYFKEANCVEGMKAISTAVEHAFHDEEKKIEPPPPTITDVVAVVTEALKKPGVVNPANPS